MSKNIGYGYVYTTKPNSRNVGNGYYDPTKVGFVEDKDGEVYVDNVLCKILKMNELDKLKPIFELANETFDGSRDPIYTNYDLFAEMDEWTLFFDGLHYV